MGNSPVNGGEFPSQRPVTWSFGVFLICDWINSRVNNIEAGDLRRHRAHYDVIVMPGYIGSNTQIHDDVMTCKRIPPFVVGIHPVMRILVLLLSAWTSYCTHSRVAGDLRPHEIHMTAQWHVLLMNYKMQFWNWRAPGNSFPHHSLMLNFALQELWWFMVDMTVCERYLGWCIFSFDIMYFMPVLIVPYIYRQRTSIICTQDFDIISIW